MSPSHKACIDYQLGLWKSTNNVGNNNTADNNLLADEKGYWKRGAGIYLYIHLYY